MNAFDWRGGRRLRIAILQRRRYWFRWVAIEEVPPLLTHRWRGRLWIRQRFTLRPEPAEMNGIGNRNYRCFFEWKRAVDSSQQSRLRREIHQVFGLARKVERSRRGQIAIQEEFFVEVGESVAFESRAIQANRTQIISR